jgi:hypoxanthine phosphoribosyltransferase
MQQLPNNLSERIREVYSKATCIFTKKDVDAALDKMADEITAKVSNSSPIFICVLLGGIVPLGNLLPRLNFPLELDYAHATRYNGKTHGGEITWRAQPRSNLTNRTIVIVDDILDGGITLAAIKNYCLEQGAKEVFTAVLIDKQKSREPNALQDVDFKGLIVDDKFIFGYGLDYEEYLRNIPGIYAVAPEHQ